VIIRAFTAFIFVCLFVFNASLSAQQVIPSPAPTTGTVPSHDSMRIAPGSKLFIEPMDGYETYLSAAILKKKVPVMVVDDRSKADFVMTGGSHVDKAGWAKTIFVSPLPHAEASVAIKDAHSGNLVFAYNVDKSNAARANQSTAEACAKHLKEAIEKK